jgi:hypothetical protein
MSKQKKFKTKKERKKERKQERQKERKKERMTEKPISYNNNVFETFTEFLIARTKVGPEEGGRRIALKDNTER